VFLPFSQRSRAWEPLARQLRKKVPESPGGPAAFDPWQLAPLVGLQVVHCSFQGLTEEERGYLSESANDHWSGGVYPATLPDGSRLCMLNPAHPHRRNKITLMEEIAHCFLEHSPTSLVTAGGSRHRDFNRDQESEAYGVGAATLLPWNLFFHRLDSGCSINEISEEFDVTPDLVSYRIKICGATALFQNRTRKKRGS
jgi:hypothetical protein